MHVNNETLSHKRKSICKITQIDQSSIFCTNPLNASVGDHLFSEQKHSVGFISAVFEEEVAVILTTHPHVLHIGQTLVNEGAFAVNVYVDSGGVFSGVGTPLFLQNEGRSSKKIKAEIFKTAPPMSARRGLHEQCVFGVAKIDAFYSCGLGQRALFLIRGGFGEEVLLFPTMRKENYENRKFETVFAGVSMSDKKMRSVIAHVQRGMSKIQKNCFDHCTFVMGNAQGTVGEQFVSVYTALSIAEQKAERGSDVLVVINCLHSLVSLYREISMKSATARPGKGSLPVNTFSIESGLFERGGAFIGKGTITILGLIKPEDVFQTNELITSTISIVDGQILIDNNNIEEGSVSRLGSAVQSQALRHFSKSYLMEIKKCMNVERDADLVGKENLAVENLELYNRSKKWRVFLSQRFSKFEMRSPEECMVASSCVNNPQTTVDTLMSEIKSVAGKIHGLSIKETEEFLSAYGKQKN